MVSPTGFIILTYVAVFQVIVVAVPWSPFLFSGTAVPATDGASSVVTASPNPTSSAPPTNATGHVETEYALTGFDKCTERGFDINHIEDGFSDMIKMIGRDELQPLHIDRYPPIDWVSAAAIDFWGQWLAQAEGGQGSDPVDNAENYALFMLANYVHKDKGFYPQKYQVPLDPVPPPKTQAVNSTKAGNLDGDDLFEYDHYCYVKGIGDAGANAVNASSPNVTAT